MVIRISRSTPLLWRSPTEIQLGSAADSPRLAGLTEAEQRLLRLLQSGIHEPDFERVAADFAIDDRAQSRILAAVEQRLERQPPESLPGLRSGDDVDLSQDFVDSAIAEIARANLEFRVDGRAVLEHRARQRVYLESLERTGLMVARALSAAGVGELVTTDSSKVVASDIGSDGYPARARFAQRGEAAELIVTQGYSPTKTRFTPPHPSVLASSRVAVLIAHGSIEPNRHQRWLRLGVAHIAVVFSDAGFWVSPMIRPGGRPCLLCFENQRTDDDESWPILAAQLARTSAEFADTASRWLAVSRVCEAVLDFIDEPFSEREGRPSQLSPSGAHPDCVCALGSGAEVGDKP